MPKAGIIGMIVGIVVAVVFIAVGSYIVSRKDYAGKVNGIIQNASCQTNTRIVNNKISVSNHCNLNVKYTVDGKDYNKNFSTSDRLYSQNESIPLRYDPSNPNNADLDTVSSKVLGSVFIVLGILVLIGSSVGMYYAIKSD